MKLFFDIETIPADEKIKSVAVNQAKQKQSRNPNNKNTRKDDDGIYRDTAISGDFGRIFCIGYAKDSEKVEIIKGEESSILKAWWQVADSADLFIGHNIMDFDLRFIFKRSIINKIRPAAKHLNLSFARYRNFPIFDTMREWEKWSTSYIALDTLAKALGLESSKNGGIDGSKVFDYYLAQKFDEIYEYCKRDVELTRKIYNRMVFED